MTAPVFIIGCGRAGTTPLYELLAGHPDLAWISNFTNKRQCRPQFAALSFTFRQPQRMPLPRKLKARPVEGYRSWDMCRPVDDSPSDPPLTRDDVLPGEAERVREMAASLMRWQRRPRFLNKNTRSTRRIGWLDAIFPDAVWVHVVRDPRATASSLLRVHWWPGLAIWCADGVTPAEWEANGHDAAELAAKLWTTETQLVLDQAPALGNRYMRVAYEDLVIDPASVTGEILDHAGLRPDVRFGRHVDAYGISDRREGWRSDLSRERQDLIAERTVDTAALVGYELPG